ncbi:MAG: DUF2306 domain-containing protein, partial [Pseudomonadota bacterium]
SRSDAGWRLFVLRLAPPLIADARERGEEGAMSLTPLLEASWIVQTHAFAAIAAFFLGLVQLLAPKGTLPHKMLGVLWVVLMATISLSSIFIKPSQEPGLPFLQWFSWIHAFTVMTLFGVISGTSLLLRGGQALKRHAAPFISIYVGGLIIAGGFAFLPGRIMHAVMFGAG